MSQRDALDKKIAKEDEEIHRLQLRLQFLSKRLVPISTSMAQKMASIASYDQTIAEAKLAYGEVRH